MHATPEAALERWERATLRAFELSPDDADLDVWLHPLARTLERLRDTLTSERSRGQPVRYAPDTGALLGLIYGARTHHWARELLRRAPAPSTFLEFGAGLGPFAAAHLATGVPATSAHLVERQRTLHEPARRVFAELGLPHPSTYLQWPDAFAGREPCGVALPFVLNELAPQLEDPAARAEHIWRFMFETRLLSLPAGSRIYLLEPGTPTAARTLQHLRERALTSFRLLAPCTHAGACPRLLGARDWCHFRGRAPLAPIAARLCELTRQPAPFRSYAYLILERRGSNPTPPEAEQDNLPARVLEVGPHPKGKRRARICGADGELVLTALERHRELAQSLSSLQSGDLVTIDRAACTERGDGLRMNPGALLGSSR